MIVAGALLLAGSALLAQGRGAPTPPGSPGRGGITVGPPGGSPSLRSLLIYAADWRWFCPFIAKGEQNVPHSPEHPEVVALKALNDALSDIRPDIRRLAIQGLARTDSNMTEVARLRPRQMLDSDDASVRATAADAIGLSFDGLARDPIYGISVMAPWNPEIFADTARLLLETRLRSEGDPVAAGAMLRSLARLPLDDNRASIVENTLGSNLTGRMQRVIGAAAGLEILARRAPKLAFSLETIRRLRDIAEGANVQVIVDRQVNDADGTKTSEVLAYLRRLALLVLHESNNDSTPTLIVATRDADWQMRRLAATYLPARDDAAADRLETLLGDRVFQVRAAALASLAPRMSVTLLCGRLLDALNDTSQAVVMTAIDVAPANCSEADQLRMWLRDKASTLGGAIGAWHVPMRALAALVRLKDPTARSLNASIALTHTVWQVRAATADLTADLHDETTAMVLAADANPNVVAAALRALTTLKSTRQTSLALSALATSLNGATVLAAAAAVPDNAWVEDARTAFERALRRLSAKTQRDVRIGLIEHYRRFLFRDSFELRGLLRDPDPMVAEAAAAALTQATHQPVRAEPYLTAPIQPPLVGLRAPFLYATLALSTGGAIKIELLNDDAPGTVAWFVSQFKADAQGPMFIDVSPGIGIRTAGAQDNTVDGWGAFVRDELGEQPHTRGSVAMMANNYDLGNGQIFIDLIDRPDLDHGYTVFARIVNGIELADRILPGVRITRVTLSTR